MRKLRLMTQLSVDGFIADANEKTDWMIWNWGPDWRWDEELKKDFNTVHASVDSVLLSRKMAEEGFVGHWTEVAKQSAPEYEFARKITDARKVVFTKTLFESRWHNTYLATGDVIDEINILKNQSGKDIIAYGGATFASSLIKTRMIDEYHLLINPTALSKGLSIFNDVGDQLKLKLVQAKAYACGLVAMVYTP